MLVKTRHETFGIVLRAFNYGDYDRVVRFFTLDYGKIAGIAKGAKNSRRRFPGTLEPWCLSRVSFTQTTPDRLVFLERCEPVDYFGHLRSDPVKAVYAAKIGEMVEAFSPDRKKNEGLFLAFRDFLTLLEQDKPRESLLLCFEARVLTEVGYAPVLEHCVACERPVSEEGIFSFVAEAGGVKCDTCLSARDKSPLRVSTGTLKTLRLAFISPPERLPRVKFSFPALREGRLLIDIFVRHLLGRNLKTAKVLDQIGHR